MALSTLTQLAFFLVLLYSFTCSSSLHIDVRSFGAKPDGRTDSTRPFLAAWNVACHSRSPVTFYVPKGRFLIGKIDFRGPCANKAIFMAVDGTLVAPSHYSVLGNSLTWILFQYVDGVTWSGGHIDGRGASLWSCKMSHGNCPVGATSLEFANSNNIQINGLTSMNSNMFHIATFACNNVKMSWVTIAAPGNSPNTDGIHIQESNTVTILNSKIATGDDCLSIGPGTSHVWVETITCGPGHGISIGSLGWRAREGGVYNVTVKGAIMTGTQNGVRIKSWGKQSNGYARKIVFEHVDVNNVHNPIVIDQFYCPNGNCPRRDSGVKVSDVTYRNIHGTSASKVAVLFDCSKTKPCTGLRMEDVKLRYGNYRAEASCSNAGGATFGTVRPDSCLTRKF